jgi:hypothetical protein
VKVAFALWFIGVMIFSVGGYISGLTGICAAVYPYASPLAAVFAPIRVAGVTAYLTGVLGRFATERRLRTYGVYETVELARFCICRVLL